MKTIEKLNKELYLDEYADIFITLTEKINELTQELNEINCEVKLIHEWKLLKEGI